MGHFALNEGTWALKPPSACVQIPLSVLHHTKQAEIINQEVLLVFRLLSLAERTWYHVPLHLLHTKSVSYFYLRFVFVVDPIALVVYLKLFIC